MTNTTPRLCPSPRLARLALLAALIAQSGCVMWLQEVPHTPRLENLNSQMVFSMVPPIPWTQVQPDDPARAPVDVQCGIGPSIGTADLYAAVVVHGRPPAGTVAPLNVSLLIDRSVQISGYQFGQMISAAQAFVTQLRDGYSALRDRLLRRRLRAAPPDGDRAQHAPDGLRRHSKLAAIRQREPGGWVAGRPGRGLRRLSALAGQSAGGVHQWAPGARTDQVFRADLAGGNLRRARRRRHDGRLRLRAQRALCCWAWPTPPAATITTSTTPARLRSCFRATPTPCSAAWRAPSTSI